jgi:hypothetical protein
MFKGAGEIAQDVLQKAENGEQVTGNRRQAGSPDPRHVTVRKVIAESYAAANGLTVPWTGHTAKVLADLLDNLRAWPADVLVRCVRNRFRSDGINPSEEPVRWIPKLPNYAHAPLDEYGSPKRIEKPHPPHPCLAEWRRLDAERRKRLGLPEAGGGEADGQVGR